MLRIKEARNAKGLTQVEVAKMIGISQNGYSNWETGRNRIDMNSLMKLAAIFGVTVDYLLGEGTEKSHGIRIPVLGDVAAGIPIEAIENIVDYEEIDAALAATGEFFGLRIKGDSMEPRIQEGDVVIVRKQSDADTGDTAVILVNGDSATVKRVKKEPGGDLWLIPNNPAYETKHYTPEEIRTMPVNIIGRVMELRGKF